MRSPTKASGISVADTSNPNRTSVAVPQPDGVGSIVLRGVTVTVDSDIGRAFVTDCARHVEGSLTDDDIKCKWTLSHDDWQGLAQNAPLLHAVRAERESRILSGVAAREAAQRLFVKAPNVLGEILTDTQVPPRHRVEAARELRQAAAVGDTPLTPRESFKIVINLGGDEKLVYEKEIAPKQSLPPDDGELS